MLRLPKRPQALEFEGLAREVPPAIFHDANAEFTGALQSSVMALIVNDYDFEVLKILAKDRFKTGFYPTLLVLGSDND